MVIIRLGSFQNKRLEQLIDIILDQQGVSKYAHDFDNRTTNLIIMLNDTNEAICDDSDMYLNTISIFTLTPKRLDLEMLLNLLEQLMTRFT